MKARESPQKKVLAQVSNMINATRMRVSVGENLLRIMAEETDEETASGAETERRRWPTQSPRTG